MDGEKHIYRSESAAANTQAPISAAGKKEDKKPAKKGKSSGKTNCKHTCRSLP